MAIRKIKISELPLADTLVGLYTIGVNALNKSVKVSMDDVIKSSLKFTPQTLTPAQQQQARDNIGAQQQPVGSALTPLFVARGAVYNATTGYYELNGLTDITEAQMIAIYNYTSQSPNSPDWAGVFWTQYSIRTNFEPCGLFLDIHSDSTFAQTNLEVITIIKKFYVNTHKVVVDNINTMFDLAYKLKKIIGVLDLKRISSIGNVQGFNRSPYLEDVRLFNLSFAIYFSQASKFSMESIIYMITNRSNTVNKPITITLHPTVFAIASANPDIQALLPATSTKGEVLLTSA